MVQETAARRERTALELLQMIRLPLAVHVGSHEIGRVHAGETEDQEREEEAVAEDEAAFEASGQTVMEIPSDLVSKVRELIAKHKVE